MLPDPIQIELGLSRPLSDSSRSDIARGCTLQSTLPAAGARTTETPIGENQAAYACRLIVFLQGLPS
jgi:hypothetical protein